ncbi:Collectin-12 [Mactra antiquata]
MYEYDCKPTYPIIVADNSGFTAVQFGGQIGYVASNPGYLSIESCPGVPMKGDLVVSTSAPSSTASTTVIITTPGSSSPPSTQTTASTTQSTPITASTTQSTPTTTLTTQNPPTTTSTTQNTPTTTSTTQSTTTTTSTTQSTTTTMSTPRSTTTAASTTQSATTTASTSQSTTTTASTTRSTTTTASTTKNIPTTAPVTHGSVSKLVPVTATIIVPKTTVKHHSNHHRTTKHSTAAVTQKTITSSVHSQSTTPSVHSQSTRCHNNWVYQFQSCYYFNMVDSLRHLQASDYCAHHNAHLVFIDSQQKQQWFASQLSTLFSHTSGSTQHPINIWTGGVRHGTVWNWVNGKSDTHSPFGYKNWTPSYPDVALNSHDKACLGIVASNGSHWKDFACKRQFHFICERGALAQTKNYLISFSRNPLPGNHVQTTPPSTGTQNGCEPGWTFHDKSCYLFNFKDQIGLTAAEETVAALDWIEPALQLQHNYLKVPRNVSTMFKILVQYTIPTILK